MQLGYDAILKTPYFEPPEKLTLFDCFEPDGQLGPGGSEIATVLEELS